MLQGPDDEDVGNVCDAGHVGACAKSVCLDMLFAAPSHSLLEVYNQLYGGREHGAEGLIWPPAAMAGRLLS